MITSDVTSLVCLQVARKVVQGLGDPRAEGGDELRAALIYVDPQGKGQLSPAQLQVHAAHACRSAGFRGFGLFYFLPSGTSLSAGQD